MWFEGVAAEYLPNDRVRGPAVGWGQEDPEWFREQASYFASKWKYLTLVFLSYRLVKIIVSLGQHYRTVVPVVDVH